jgi:hypothetical protein
MLTASASLIKTKVSSYGRRRRPRRRKHAVHATTIDLMLASQELASDVLKCKIHDTEHGLDHRAIETSFDVDILDHAIQPLLLFKNAP